MESETIQQKSNALMDLKNELQEIEDSSQVNHPFGGGDWNTLTVYSTEG